MLETFFLKYLYIVYSSSPFLKYRSRRLNLEVGRYRWNSLSWEAKGVSYHSAILFCSDYTALSSACKLWFVFTIAVPHIVPSSLIWWMHVVPCRVTSLIAMHYQYLMFYFNCLTIIFFCLFFFISFVFFVIFHLIFLIFSADSFIFFIE